MKITGANILDQNGIEIATGVTITSIDCNGCNVYISYVDGSSNLHVVRSYITSASAIFATSATVVS